MTKPSSSQPLITFALFAYNQENYIKAAVQGAFAQNYQPLEIILSDDGSSDRTFEIMSAMAKAYHGPHRVRARQNTLNAGLGAHVNAVLAESKGAYIAFAAGDDISYPDRIEHFVQALERFKKLHPEEDHVSFLSGLEFFTDDGKVLDHTGAGKAPKEPLFTLGPDNIFSLDIQDLVEGKLTTSGPSRIIDAAHYKMFGDMDENCFTEDIIYLFRTALAGQVLRSARKTVLYRQHDQNLSSHSRLYSMPFQAVEKQMRSDLRTAIKLDLISPKNAAKAMKWIDANVALRSFYKAKIDGERPTLNDVKTLLSARHFSGRRKFGLFREYLGLR